MIRETMQQRCERIALVMGDDLLAAGIPKERHIAAIGFILDDLTYYKDELEKFYQGIAKGIADVKAGRVVPWDEVEKELNTGEG